jgi:Tfp pilus assembly protein FimT
MRYVKRQHRQGITLPELAVACTLIGLTSAIAVPRFSAFTNRLTLRSGTSDVRTALAIAPIQAVRRGEFVAVVGDATRGRIRVVSGADTLYSRDLGARGLTLALTRDSITWSPNGQGWGAANTTIIVARRGAADTITVSRLGRVR